MNISEKKILGYIPARSKSKGLKNKNILLFKNKPLFYHSIDFAKKLNNVFPFVSTESKKYLNLVKKYYPDHFDYIRPEKYAKDNSLIASGLKHGIKWLEKKHKLKFDYVILIQPTCPIRSYKYYNQIIKKFFEKKLTSLITVKEVNEYPQKMINLKSAKKWNFIVKHNYKLEGRQAFKKHYIIDGNFYMFTKKFFYRTNSFFKENETYIQINQQKKNIDIDTLSDLNSY